MFVSMGMINCVSTEGLANVRRVAVSRGGCELGYPVAIIR